MKALAIVLVLAGTARADWRDMGGGAQLHYELSTVHAVEQDAMAPPTSQELVLAGARLHGFAGGKRFAYHLGVDLAAGGTVRAGGFAYDVALFPVGVALRFAETSFITLGAGVGASGAIGTLDDAATFPVEARFELGRGIRVLGRARATYLVAADARQSGARSTRFADELDAMLGVRFGKAYDEGGFPTGNGYFVGVTYREALGARFTGAVIGYSIDMATRRTRRNAASHDDGYGSCEDCE